MRRLLLGVIPWLPVFFLGQLMVAAVAGADGVSFRNEFTYTNSTSDVTNEATGQKTTTDFSRLLQRYNLDISRNLFPYLRFATGTYYETTDSTSTTEDVDSDFDEKIIRPYVELSLDNPFYQAGIEAIRTQVEEEGTGLPDNTSKRDELNGSLGWRPVDFPRMNLNVFNIRTHDDLDTVDTSEQLITFDSSYEMAKGLHLDYLYTRNDVEDDLLGLETLDQNHTARADYYRDFFNNRLSLNAAYMYRQRTFEFSGAAGAEIPLLRSAGLSSLDDFPDEGAMDNNPALIDGDTNSSAGIDIGLGGDETTFANIGIDFGFPTNVDKIELWVDRRLTSTVANSFSWDVYTSTDNEEDSTWSLVASVSNAPFGTLDNRFEISFPSVNTRYIKVVVRPLSPTVPDAALFPNIFVTEMEAFRRATEAEEGDEQETVDHSFNVGLRGRLTEQTILGYNFYYRSQEEDPAPDDRTQMTNDFFINHFFNDVFSGASRFSLTDTEEGDEDSMNYDYSASLRARYLETLEQSLTYSWRKDDEEEEGVSDQRTVLLRTIAQLYRGWSAFVDLGHTWDNPADKSQITTRLIRAGTNLIPHHNLTINMHYERSEDRQPEEQGGDSTETNWEVQAFYTLSRTLSFNVQYTVVDREDSKQTLQNYSANWSPFPDGALQFFFSYNESLRPEDDQRERSFGPSIRWTVNPHTFLDVFYTVTEDDSQTETVEGKSLNANVRILF